MRRLSIEEKAKLSLYYGIVIDDTLLRRSIGKNKHMIFKEAISSKALYKLEFVKDVEALKIQINDGDNQRFEFTWNEFEKQKNSNLRVVYSVAVNFVDKLSQHIFNKKMSTKKAVEKLFSLDQKPFDIEMEFDSGGGIISFPLTDDTEVIRFDSSEIKDLNLDKVDRIAKYLLGGEYDS